MPPNDFVQSASRRRLFFGENLSYIFVISYFCGYFIFIFLNLYVIVLYST